MMSLGGHIRNRKKKARLGKNIIEGPKKKKVLGIGSILFPNHRKNSPKTEEVAVRNYLEEGKENLNREGNVPKQKKQTYPPKGEKLQNHYWKNDVLLDLKKIRTTTFFEKRGRTPPQ